LKLQAKLRAWRAGLGLISFGVLSYSDESRPAWPVAHILKLTGKACLRNAGQVAARLARLCVCSQSPNRIAEVAAQSSPSSSVIRQIDASDSAKYVKGHSYFSLPSTRVMERIGRLRFPPKPRTARAKLRWQPSAGLRGWPAPSYGSPRAVRATFPSQSAGTATSQQSKQQMPPAPHGETVSSGKCAPMMPYLLLLPRNQRR
jgi:hypothetical protein